VYLYPYCMHALTRSRCVAQLTQSLHLHLEHDRIASLIGIYYTMDGLNLAISSATTSDVDNSVSGVPRTPLEEYMTAVNPSCNIDVTDAKVRMRSLRRMYKCRLGDRINMRSIASSLRKCASLRADPDMLALYIEASEVDASAYLAKCILFYKRRCRLPLVADDVALLENESKTPTGQSLPRLLELYAQGVGGLESKYTLYGNKIRTKTSSKPVVHIDPENGQPNVVPKRNAPFNEFIQIQWAARAEELKAVAKEHGSSSVMKMLGTEWRNRDVPKKTVCA
jgi:hypothetical protein